MNKQTDLMPDDRAEPLTAAQRDGFVAALAQSADVAAAAQAAGVTETAAHTHRARDRSFAAAWRAALARAVVRLETLLLQRAIEALSGAATPAGKGERMTFREALALLAHHRATQRDAREDASAEKDGETSEQMRARILASLEEMEARLAANNARS